MSSLRRLTITGAFALALTLPAFAGQIETTVAPPQPAPASATASQPTANGQIETTLTGQDETGSGEASATDSATVAVLNLLQSVLALF